MEANKAAPVSQVELAMKIQEKYPIKYRNIKYKPVVAYVVTSDNYNRIPDFIKYNIGFFDNAAYINRAIILQLNDKGEPDFYLISKDDLGGYSTVETECLEEKNPSLYSYLTKEIGIDAYFEDDSDFLGVIKLSDACFYQASDVGYPINEELVIEAPWGGTQTKPAGEDCFLVPQNKGGKYYMINDNEDGNPIGYIDSGHLYSCGRGQGE